MTKFICRECSGSFDVSFAKKGTVTSIGTGKCKGCQREYSKRKNMEFRMKAFPEKFRVCDDCDKYYSIFDGNGPMEHPNNCKYCNSLNTQWVLE